MSLYKKWTTDRYLTIAEFPERIQFLNGFKMNFTQKFELTQIKNPVFENLENIFSFQRFEINRAYPLKKITPSPRGTHPFFPVIQTGSSLYVFDSYENGWVTLKSDIYTEGSVLYLVADERKVCSIYGEFGQILMLLELGHILSVLQSTMQEVIVQGFEIDLKSPGGRLEGLESGHRIYSISKLRMEPFEDDVTHIKQSTDFSQNNRMLDSVIFDKLTKPIVFSLHEIVSYRESDFWEKSFWRHSNNKKVGIYSTYSNPSFTWINHLKKLISSLSTCDDRWTFYLVSMDDDKGAYRIEKNTFEKINNVDDVNISQLLNDSDGYSLQDGADFIILFNYRPNDKNDLQEFIKSHVKAGMIMHSAQLILSEKTTYTRPIKNLNDEFCLNFFGSTEDSFFLYGLIVGKDDFPLYYDWSDC